MTTTKYLTTKDLLVIFGVTTQTLHNWRATGELVATVKDRSVYYTPKTIRAFAKRSGRRMLVDPEKQLGKIERAKPGPKPRVTH